MVVCEHSVCDGLSLSTVAHELLIALSDDNNSDMFANSLSWPPTMETAIHRSLSLIGKLLTLIRFIFVVLFLRITDTLKTARIPLGIVDFPLTDMVDYCHTETCYGMLNKEETQKLLEKCRRRGVTVTSAVSSAIICSASTLVNSQEDRSTALRFSIEADSRRRCVPPVPNHDLSYHISGMLPFTTHTKDIPTTSQDMWLLAKTFGHHIKTSIEAGYILAIGMIMGMICQKNLESPNLTDIPTCDISSWGVLPFCEQYGPWKLVAMTPSLNMVRSLIPLTTIQTVNGILTIMYAGAGPLIRLSVLESLRDRTMQKLHEMIRD